MALAVQISLEPFEIYALGILVQNVKNKDSVTAVSEDGCECSFESDVNMIM